MSAGSTLPCCPLMCTNSLDVSSAWTSPLAGEMFSVHRWLLAANSLVFMAELLCSFEKTVYIQVDDMEAEVFKSMLHFIYNDGLPEIEKSDDVFVMAQHLLVVADRPKLERLKLICQYVWTNSLTQARLRLYVNMSLRLHWLSRLKEACSQFLRCPGILKEII